MGFSGSKFTWLNKRGEGQFIMECLDHALCNLHWLHLFPSSPLLYLPRTTSDHYSILLRMDAQCVGKKRHPDFRMQLSWFEHDGFVELVHDHWQHESSDFMAMFRSFSHAALVWNKEKFGNILWRKRNYLVQLGGIQKGFERGPSDFLSGLELQLIMEYGQIIKTKELFWFQKSRAKQFVDEE